MLYRQKSTQGYFAASTTGCDQCELKGHGVLRNRDNLCTLFTVQTFQYFCLMSAEFKASSYR